MPIYFIHTILYFLLYMLRSFFSAFLTRIDDSLQSRQSKITKTEKHSTKEMKSAFRLVKPEFLLTTVNL